MEVNKITKEQAIALAESKFYEQMSHEEIARFQLFEPLLCMPFGVFHEAMEKVLNRPVFTHEFAYEDIKKEYLGTKEPPSFDEILSLIPESKRVIITL